HRQQRRRPAASRLRYVAVVQLRLRRARARRSRGHRLLAEGNVPDPVRHPPEDAGRCDREIGSGAASPMTNDLAKTQGRRGISIRAKILSAFLAICMFSGAAAGYAVYGMTQAGELVVETYDKPLMSISFARAVHADFAEIQVVFMRLLAAPH